MLIYINTFTNISNKYFKKVLINCNISKFRIKFSDNRIEKTKKFIYQRENDLLKKQNLFWLKNNKHLMNPPEIKKFKSFMKK